MNAEARGKRNKKPEDTQPDGPNLQAEARLLEQAWDKLQSGLRDYQGHRAKAQHQTQLAAGSIGLRFTPNPRPRLSQAESDARLREARALLAQVQPLLAGKNQPRAVTHVANAVQQIDLALAIR